ncbi:MAG: class IV adenylate cyclase [Candidatus Woesearchaeota archaeon]
MDEIEVKILNIDPKKIILRLEELGAEKIFDGRVETYFYDTDGCLKENNDMLRLRKMGDKTFLTFKHKISKDEVKIYDELETEVSDFNKMRDIIEALDYRQEKKLTKTRSSYAIGNVKFEIDKFLDDFADIPTFLEIEAESKEEIFRNAELLGFTKKDCCSRSTDDIIREYKEKNK